MRFLVLYFLLGCGFLSYGQQDSALYQMLQIENDTERINQLYKAGFELRNTDPQLSYRYAQAAEAEAQNTNSKKHRAKPYNLKGVLYYKKGDYTKALHYQHKALLLNESAQYQYGIAVNQINLGNIYSDMGYDVLAERSYLRAMKAYNNLNNRPLIIKCLINLGTLQGKLKAYAIALKYFHTALSMANEDEDLSLMANCNSNIGAIFMEQGITDSSLLYLEEGWKLLNLQDNKVEMADVYTNMATVYIKKGNFEQAVLYLNLADSISNVYDYTDARVYVYETYAFFFEKQQDYQKANAWLKKHYRLKDSILQLSREDPLAFYEEEFAQVEENPQPPAFKNGWILVILGALLAGVPLFLIRYKR